MSEGTITSITILLFVFVLSGFIWPLALGVHLELEGMKKRGEPPAYDERQKLVRLRAGNHALGVLLGFLALWAAVDRLDWFDWTSSILDLALCAMLLAWCVWASECILHDGFTSWKDRSGYGMSGTYCVWMILFVRPFCTHGITASWMPFILACVNIAVIFGVVVYKHRKEKRAEKEENTP